MGSIPITSAPRRPLGIFVVVLIVILVGRLGPARNRRRNPVRAVTLLVVLVVVIVVGR